MIFLYQANECIDNSKKENNEQQCRMYPIAFTDQDIIGRIITFGEVDIHIEQISQMYI